MGSSPTAFLLLVAALTCCCCCCCAAEEEMKPIIAKRGCAAQCGAVDIPYPFGIGAGCFRPGFEIVCYNGNMPILPSTTLTKEINTTPVTERILVLSLSVTPRAEVRVSLPVAYQCFDLAGNVTSGYRGQVTINPSGVYRISHSRNELFVLGCNTFMFAKSGPRGRYSGSYYGGCVAYCNDAGSARDGACAGIGCCHVEVPPGLTDSGIILSTWPHKDLEYSPCNYAFITEKGNYSFKVTDLTREPTNWTIPLRLDWAIRDGDASMSSCAQLGYKPAACVSNHSECVDSTNGRGYLCNCTMGYQGNPYLADGCKNINECAESRVDYPCNGVCHDTDGSYDCSCPLAYGSSDAKLFPCNPKFSFAAKLALGIGLSVSLSVVALLLSFIVFQKRQLDKLFVKNGGKILQNVKGLTIFTKEGLKKITKNNSEFLGSGSFGQVYKGTLPDGTIVAVKASIIVNEGSKGEFTEEVEIQSNMIHKNILRLVGCCLEVDVPMLVYEFATNGSLRDILHSKSRNQMLPLDMRLDIAIGSAEGLRYMHLYTTQAIRHGDVKPDNILLGDELTPKISDFGLSKLVKEGYFAKTVVGCMGYIDPVFMKTGLLTQKSDVYSFGAVLLELITGKENVYGKNLSLIIEFCKVYEKENSGRAMFDKEIAIEEDIFVLEEISKLAIECLKEDIDDRPDMTEVAERLVMLRRDKKLGMTHNRSSSPF